MSTLQSKLAEVFECVTPQNVLLEMAAEMRKHQDKTAREIGTRQFFYTKPSEIPNAGNGLFYKNAVKEDTVVGCAWACHLVAEDINTGKEIVADIGSDFCKVPAVPVEEWNSSAFLLTAELVVSRICPQKFHSVQKLSFGTTRVSRLLELLLDMGWSVKMISTSSDAVPDYFRCNGINDGMFGHETPGCNTYFSVHPETLAVTFCTCKPVKADEEGTTGYGHTYAWNEETPGVKGGGATFLESTDSVRACMTETFDSIAQSSSAAKKDDHVCFCCGKPALKRCPCNTRLYCGVECQKKDWRRGGHRAECTGKKKKGGSA